MSTSYNDEFNSSLYTSRAARLLSQHLKNSATANINCNQSTGSTTVICQITGYNFAIEDTTDKCYRDITCELMSKGWKKVSYRSKRSKLERKRLPHKEVPLFVSQLNEKDVDFAELAEQQICNHFEGIHCLTTKRGFADVLHDMQWVGAASADISPRGFNLGDPVHREEFIDDFRLTAAVNILKIYTLLNSDSGANYENNRKTADKNDRSASSSSINERKSNTTSATHLKVNTTMLHTAIAVVQWHLRIALHGEWSGVDSNSFFKGRSECLEEGGWRELVNYSYKLVAQLHDTHSDVNTLLKCMYGATKKHKKTLITGHKSVSENQSSPNKNKPSSVGPYLHKSALYLQVIVLLRMLHRVSSQFLMEGVKNIWVVKAPESSCGIGIKLFHKLQDILECERGMGGRTVQKYIETPLLARISSTETAERGDKTARSDNTQQQSISRGVRDGGMFKFDLRIWVLVTSFQPLVAYIYPTLYGRRCGNAYNSELSSLSDSYAHLTNYSVQKKAVKPSSNGSSNGNSNNTPRNVASMSAFELFQLQQKQQSNIAKAQQQQQQSARESSYFEEDDASVASEHSTSSNQTSSSAKKLRNMCSSFRDISPSVQQQQQQQQSQYLSATPRGNRAIDSSVASTQQVSEQELLMTHDEVVRVVELQHQRNQQRSGLLSSTGSSSGTNRLKHSPPSDSYWQRVVWPEIKRKVVATLQVTQDRVVPRERSFQFLGYDVLLDAQLVPWILEVNMSPAMAHRNPQQSALIAAMCRGLVALAVLPWVGGDLGEGLEDCYRVTPDEAAPKTTANTATINPNSNAGGTWEKLELDANESFVTSNTQITLPIVNAPAVANKPYNLVAPSDDWTDITSNASSGRAKVMSRPKSASSAVRRKPLSIQQLQQQQFTDVKVVPSVSLPVPGLDSSFVLVARAVTIKEILFADVCCIKFGRILLLQRWAVRYLSRVRLYHSRRKMASTRIQTLIRLYLAKCRVFHLKQRNAAVVVQKQTRRLLARLFCDRLRRTNAAVVLQSIVRRKLACILRRTLYRRLKSGVLVLWYHGRYAAKRRRAARKVVLMLQRWHRRRRHFAQIVLHSIALHFRKRVNRRVKIQRCFRCWRVRVRLFEALRLVTLKSLASTIAAEVGTRRDEAQRIAECELFEQEDALSFAVRQHSIAVESAAQCCAESIWDELLRVEVVEIASYTRRYVHVVQTTDIESLLAKQFVPSTKKTLTLSSPPEQLQAAVQSTTLKQKKKSRSSHVSEPSRHLSADSRQMESEEAHQQLSPDLDRLAARNNGDDDQYHDRLLCNDAPSFTYADAPVSPGQTRKALSALSAQIDSSDEPQHELKSSRKHKKNVAKTSKTSDVTCTTSGGVSLIERSLSLASTASPLSGKATNKLYGIEPTPPTTQQYMSAITQIRNRPWSDAATTETLPHNSGEQTNMRHNASNRTLKDLLGSAEIQSIHDLLASEQCSTEQTQKASHSRQQTSTPQDMESISTSEKTSKAHTELFNLSVDGVATDGRRSERRHSEGGGSGRQRPADLTRQSSAQLLSPGFNEQAVQEASMRNAESILNRRTQKLKPQRPPFVEDDAYQSFSRVEMANHPVSDRPIAFNDLRPQSGGRRPNRPWADTTLSSGNGADFVHIMSQQQSTVDSGSDCGWNEQLIYSHQPQYVEYNDLAALPRHSEQHHQHHYQQHQYHPQTYDEVWNNAQLYHQTHENSPQFAQFSQFGQINQFSEYHQHSPHQYQVFHPLDASAGLYDPDPQVEGFADRQQVRRVRKHRGAEDPTSAHHPSSNSNNNPLRRSASAGRKRSGGSNKDKSGSGGGGGGGNGGGMKTSRSQKTK